MKNIFPALILIFSACATYPHGARLPPYAPWLTDGEARAEIEDAAGRLGAELAVPASALLPAMRGWQILVLPLRVFDCGGVQAVGCTITARKLVVLAGQYGDCAAMYLVLRHEAIHVMLEYVGADDYRHEDPIWGSISHTVQHSCP